MGSLLATSGIVQSLLLDLPEIPCTDRIRRDAFPIPHIESHPTAHRDNSKARRTWPYSVPVCAPAGRCHAVLRSQCCDSLAVSRFSSALFEQTGVRGGVEPELFLR